MSSEPTCSAKKHGKLSTGDPSIIVAVLDEGVCQTHPELRDNIWTNEDEIDGSKKDNDGNGYAGDIHGFNFVTNTGIITWDDLNDTGHGHARGRRDRRTERQRRHRLDRGRHADKPGVKIMSCQIFAGNAGGNSMSSVKAIKYAADNGAVILQCSWGYTSGTANSYEWGTPGYADEEQWETLAPLERTRSTTSPTMPDRPTARSTAASRSSPRATNMPTRPDSPALPACACR